jgi:hypothetical protein
VLAALREKTDVNVAEYARYDFRQRIALSDGISRLRRMADEAQQPCPGYETTPNRCTCDCEGCKHHCAAHQAGEAQQPETQAGCSQCGHRACMGRGRCGVVMTSEAGIVRPPCQCLGATRDVGARQADTAGEQQ